METPAPSRNASKLMYLFGFPRLGSALLLGIVGFATFNLYTVGYGLAEFWVGTALSLGYVSIAFSQFFFGWISDRWYTRWGRRKPWVVVLAPVSVFSFIALLLPGMFIQNASKDVLLVWLIVWDVLFEMAYSLTTPYGAWMAELFTIEERPKTNQIQNIFNFIGYAIMVVFTFIVLTNFTSQLQINPGVLPPIFVWSCIIFAVVFLVSYYVVIFLMPTEAPPKTKPNLLNNLKNIAQNKNYLFVVFLQGIASLGWIIISTVMLSYTQIVLAFGTLQYILAGVTLLVGIFIFLYLWRKVIAKKGKKKGILLVFTVGSIIMCCSLLGLVPFSTTLPFGLLFIAGIALSLGGWYMISGIWYADLAEDDEKKTDEMKAGLYGGFPSIALNLFQALGTFILGVVTSLPKIMVGTLSFSIGYVLWGPISAVFLVMAYFYSKRFVTLDYEWQKSPPQETA
ncbi:MAG TPA: MFS transporter [Candidatus Lokiarchaeia archaeon]|nr:MFS transporter [Candidatus Lokiarchaeia archaeon]